MKSGYPSGLTAGAIEMLIHYFYTPSDVPDALTTGAPNYRSIMELVEAGLAFRDGDFHSQGSWRLTERGLTMARHIVHLPLPVQAWTMPVPSPVSANEQLSSTGE